MARSNQFGPNASSKVPKSFVIENEEQFVAIWTICEPIIARHLTKYYGKETVELACMETKTEFWEKVVNRCRIPPSPNEANIGYFITAARRNALNLVRREARLKKALQEFAAMLEQDSKDDGPSYETAYIIALERCLSQLARITRTVVTMHYFEHLPHKVIARQLRRTDLASRLILHRGLNKLHECIMEQVQHMPREELPRLIAEREELEKKRKEETRQRGVYLGPVYDPSRNARNQF